MIDISKACGYMDEQGYDPETQIQILERLCDYIRSHRDGKLEGFHIPSRCPRCGHSGKHGSQEVLYFHDIKIDDSVELFCLGCGESVCMISVAEHLHYGTIHPEAFGEESWIWSF